MWYLAALPAADSTLVRSLSMIGASSALAITAGSLAPRTAEAMIALVAMDAVRQFMQNETLSQEFRPALSALSNSMSLTAHARNAPRSSLEHRSDGSSSIDPTESPTGS